MKTNREKLADLIEQKAATDGNYAIAYAVILLAVAMKDGVEVTLHQGEPFVVRKAKNP